MNELIVHDQSKEWTNKKQKQKKKEKEKEKEKKKKQRLSWLRNATIHTDSLCEDTKLKKMVTHKLKESANTSQRQLTGWLWELF